MNKIKETFLRKYGAWEYVLFIFGLVILYKVGEWLVTTEFESMSWEVVAFVIMFTVLAVLAVGAPKSVLDYGRKKLGLPVKPTEEPKDDGKDA